MVPIPTGTLIYFLLLTLIIGAATGLVTNLIICRWRGFERRGYLPSAILGALGFVGANLLAGWAWEKAVYVNGLPATLRTRLADHGFTIGVVFAVVLVGGWHLSASLFKHRAT